MNKSAVFTLTLTLFFPSPDHPRPIQRRPIKNGPTVELFDRNRFYSAVGYVIEKGKKVQLGVMNQTKDNWSKNQLQLSFYHSF